MSLSALEKIGIRAERLGRSGLGVGGRKFSGTAFCYRGSRVLHHGTLLVSADLEKLEQALTAPAIAIRSRAVPSERSPVMNLVELIPGLTTDRVAKMLADGLAALECPGDEGIRRLEEKHHSPDWIYGATPPFEADLFSLHSG